MPAQPIHIEPAAVADAKAIAAIHRSAFNRGWSDSEIEDLLRDETVTVLVARRIGRPRSVLGFVILRVAADEAEVLSIAVAEAARRSGIGRLLMDEASRHLYAERIALLFLEVDETNAAAFKLYDSMGFRTVGRRDAYYSAAGDGPASALVMRYDVR